MRGAGKLAFAGILLAAITSSLLGCGGGGGASNSFSSSGGSGSSLTITTATPLPGTLQGHAYTATLAASGGQGALHWSIFPVSATALFVNGLSIDAGTGVISGTANFGGTAGFIAQVSDSASPAHSATKSFTLTAVLPLQAGTSQSVIEFEYQSVFSPFLNLTGGLQPFSYSVSGNCLPPGIRISPTGQFSGTALAIGTFQCGVTVQDSLSPPEVVTALITMVVKPQLLTINAQPPQGLSHMVLNRPFSGQIVAAGGVAPYHFTLVSGTLPPGTFGSIDPNTGQFGGTPSTTGTYLFTVSVTDSASPAGTISGSFAATVVPPLGRNDTPATAILLPGNGSYSASISPYIDPPNGTPVPGDSDYYKLVSIGGATVHLETQAKRLNPNNPLDTVLEIVDGNGQQLTTCRQPGDTNTNFTSACINDDISASPHVQDSALDFQAPGASNATTTFYAHVLDWRGDARPDMSYQLSVSGLVEPLQITGPLQFYGISPTFAQYRISLTATGGAGVYTWSVISGGLPPGMSLDTAGLLSGTPTATGTYNFQAQVSDPGPPAQTTVAAMAMTIVPPLQVTTTTLPAGTVGVPYTAQIMVSGGVAPYTFTPTPSTWLVPAGLTMDPSTGIISGTPTTAGTFPGLVFITDQASPYVSQSLTLVINP